MEIFIPSFTRKSPSPSTAGMTFAAGDLSLHFTIRQAYESLMYVFGAWSVMLSVLPSEAGAPPGTPWMLFIDKSDGSFSFQKVLTVRQASLTSINSMQVFQLSSMLIVSLDVMIQLGFQGSCMSDQDR